MAGSVFFAGVDSYSRHRRTPSVRLTATTRSHANIDSQAAGLAPRFKVEIRTFVVSRVHNHQTLDAAEGLPFPALNLRKMESFPSDVSKLVSRRAGLVCPLTQTTSSVRRRSRADHVSATLRRIWAYVGRA